MDEALYETIYKTLLAEIQAGTYADGKRLPTEAQLSQRFFVSRITSKRALNKLAQQGLVVRIPGRSTYLRKDAALPPSSPLHSRHMPLIALVMGGYSASFGLDIINGAVQKAQDLHMNLIVRITNNSQQQEADTLRSLMAAGLEGIILQPAHGELYSEVILEALHQKYPIVMLDRVLHGLDIPYVGVDNRALARMAVLRLIEAGHRRIALLALEDETSSSLRERMQGCTDAFVESALAVPRELWLTRIKARVGRDNDFDAFVEAIARHMDHHADITAMFGTEHMVAAAAMQALFNRGIAVPGRMSVVGFDGELSLGLQHKLAFVRQPQLRLGAEAVVRLRAAMDGKHVKPLATILDGEWVEGSSLGPVPATTLTPTTGR